MPLDRFRRSLLKRITSSVMLTVVFLCSTTLAGDIYFISQGVGYGAMPDKKPLPATIYRLDEDQKTLAPAWSLPGDMTSSAIAVYGSLGMVAVGEGNIPKQFHIISLYCDDETQQDLRKKLRRMGGHGWLSADASIPMVSFWERSADRQDRPFRQLVFDKSSFEDDERTAEYRNMRLAGMAPIYTGHQSDAVRFYPSYSGKFRGDDSRYTDLVPSVPQGLITSKSVDAWLLIANEEDYLALTSRPDRHSMTHTELLLYDRPEATWHSRLIKGSETSLRIVNDWLVGIIANTHPEFDFKARGGYGAIPTKEVVFVNPHDGSQFTTDLEDFGEVLWVTDDETIYYHTFDPPTLYKARIQDNDLVDRQLVIKDVLTVLLHWGFEMEDCED